MNKKLIDEIILRLIVGLCTVLFGLAVQSLRSMSSDLNELQKLVAELAYKTESYDARLHRLEDLYQTWYNKNK